jgi:hypothetical protein
MPKPDIYDQRWIDKQLMPFPPEFRQSLLTEYYQEPNSFKANTHLRLTTKTVANALDANPQLFSTFSKDEIALTNEAENRSKKALKIKGKYYPFGIDAMYSALVRFVERLKIRVPKVNTSLTVTDVNPLTGLIERMCDSSWWLRSLRKQNNQRVEIAGRCLNVINKQNQIYVTDITANNRKQQIAKSMEMLNNIFATNDDGYSASLAELSKLSVSNPEIRKAELNCRIRGLEDLSKILNHDGLFITITCPSKYHASFAKTGQRNPKWNGATPIDAQAYLNKTFSLIRAQLNREKIRMYGLRVAEPNHDGTPHWHLLIFIEPQHSQRIKQIFHDYCFAEDGDEKGAKKARLKFVDINEKFGSATGYIVKYISKNIDGKHLDKGVYGEDPITAAERVNAWASCFGIRQFQQLGGVSVSVWRELRRLNEELIHEFENIEPLRQAADTSDWATYTQAMGGVFCKRKDQLLRPFYDLKSTNGELKTSKYGDSFIKQLRGISYADLPFITRTHNWELTKRQP